jgi:enamine deaminase RidA (YjgF/YER057c/UK114 family)
MNLLAKADMAVADIVKVTQYLTRAEDIQGYAAVRTRFLGDNRPASMLLVIPQLVWPEIQRPGTLDEPVELARTYQTPVAP